MKVSIIIPVYNENSTIEEILRRVKAEEIATEILVIDDGSIDGIVFRKENAAASEGKAVHGVGLHFLGPVQGSAPPDDLDGA